MTERKNVLLPATLRALILGGCDANICDVLKKVMLFHIHSRNVYLCSENLPRFERFTSSHLSKFTSLSDLPKLESNSLLIFDHVPKSTVLVSYFTRNDLSCVYLCDSYTTVPYTIREYINYAILFQQDERNVNLFHRDQIFGIGCDVFEDMCEFVWNNIDSDYLVVDMARWVYMKNFKFSINRTS